MWARCRTGKEAEAVEGEKCSEMHCESVPFFEERQWNLRWTAKCSKCFKKLSMWRFYIVDVMTKATVASVKRHPC